MFFNSKKQQILVIFPVWYEDKQMVYKLTVYKKEQILKKMEYIYEVLKQIKQDIKISKNL